MNVTFEKYHGLGNDYLVCDPAINQLDLTPSRIRLICDRNRGVGSDGILFGPITAANKVAVRIFNPDGSEAEKSGNGVRIFAKYLFDSGRIKDGRLMLSTLGGDVEVDYLNADGSLMRVFMGRATFVSGDIPVSGPPRSVVDEPMRFANEEHRVTCVSVGNPHCVIPLPDISREKAETLGPIVETAPYFPNRINMQLLKVLDRCNIAIEIFERGAGYTLASGSSSCAAACAARRLGLVDSEVTVHMPGGTLRIEIGDDYSVHMTGDATRVGTFRAAEEFVLKLQSLDLNHDGSTG